MTIRDPRLAQLDAWLDENWEPRLPAPRHSADPMQWRRWLDENRTTPTSFPRFGPEPKPEADWMVPLSRYDRADTTAPTNHSRAKPTPAGPVPAEPSWGPTRSVVWDDHAKRYVPPGQLSEAAVRAMANGTQYRDSGQITRVY